MPYTNARRASHIGFLLLLDVPNELRCLPIVNCKTVSKISRVYNRVSDVREIVRTPRTITAMQDRIQRTNNNHSTLVPTLQLHAGLLGVDRDVRNNRGRTNLDLRVRQNNDSADDEQGNTNGLEVHDALFCAVVGSEGLTGRWC